jgi:ubiquinone/menaquinone biosynthesis C-methylase UbiE
MFAGQSEIKEAYQRDDLAEDYIASRFEREPFGRAQHERQVRVVREVVSSLGVKSLLEVASGPARLTVHVPRVPRACIVEQSPAMLRIAARRLHDYHADHWQPIRGDAFRLPLADRQFDLVMAFRLIRHFDLADRQRLLAEMRRVLRPGGHVLFDVVNEPAFGWLLAKWGVTRKWVDDHWFTLLTFEREMASSGYRIVRLFPVQSALRIQYHLWARLGRRLPRIAAWLSRTLETATSRFPLEWVVLCRCE